jgi:hypothetical protein
LFVRLDKHLLYQTVAIVRTGDSSAHRHTLMATPETPQAGPPPIAHRRMAVVSRNAKGKPSVMWYQVPIFERDKVDTDTYARAISMARAEGAAGDLLVFAENDADLLRDVVSKLELAAKYSRQDRSGASTGGRLAFFDLGVKK